MMGSEFKTKELSPSESLYPILISSSLRFERVLSSSPLVSSQTVPSGSNVNRTEITVPSGTDPLGQDMLLKSSFIFPTSLSEAELGYSTMSVTNSSCSVNGFL